MFVNTSKYQLHTSKEGEGWILWWTLQENSNPVEAKFWWEAYIYSDILSLCYTAEKWRNEMTRSVSNNAASYMAFEEKKETIDERYKGNSPTYKFTAPSKRSFSLNKRYLRRDESSNACLLIGLWISATPKHFLEYLYLLWVAVICWINVESVHFEIS